MKLFGFRNELRGRLSSAYAMASNAVTAVHRLVDEVLTIKANQSTYAIRLGENINVIRDDVKLILDTLKRRSDDRINVIPFSPPPERVAPVRPPQIIDEALKANGMPLNFENFAAITKAKGLQDNEKKNGRVPNAPQPVAPGSTAWDPLRYSAPTLEEFEKRVNDIAYNGSYYPSTDEKLNAIAEFLGIVFVTAPAEIGSSAGLPDLPARVLALPAAVKKGDKVQ